MDTTTQQTTATITPTHAEALAAVQAVYTAFDRRDVEGALARFHDDVVIRQSDEVPWGGVYRGKEEAVEFFSILLSHIETRVAVDRFVVADDTVIEVGKTCGRVIATGHEFAVDEVHIWRVRDGRIAGMEAVVDNAAMLRALHMA